MENDFGIAHWANRTHQSGRSVIKTPKELGLKLQGLVWGLNVDFYLALLKRNNFLKKLLFTQNVFLASKYLPQLWRPNFRI